MVFLLYFVWGLDSNCSILFDCYHCAVIVVVWWKAEKCSDGQIGGLRDEGEAPICCQVVGTNKKEGITFSPFNLTSKKFHWHWQFVHFLDGDWEFHSWQRKSTETECSMKWSSFCDLSSVVHVFWGRKPMIGPIVTFPILCFIYPPVCDRAHISTDTDKDQGGNLGSKISAWGFHPSKRIATLVLPTWPWIVAQASQLWYHASSLVLRLRCGWKDHL